MIDAAKRFVQFELRQAVNKLGTNTSRSKAKVFCVGYVKTGTTSFGAAMRILGSRHTSYSPYVYRSWFKKGRLDKILNFATSFDSFDDLPYSRLDLIALCVEFFPNSQFVLLERDPDQWLKSWLAHRTRNNLPMPRYPELAKDWMVARNEYLKQFFALAGIENRLLTMDITRGDGFEKLCPFLAKPFPESRFPWENSRTKIETKLAIQQSRSDTDFLPRT